MATDSGAGRLIAQGEAHATFSRAVADADAKRVESLRQLQTMLRGYDLALSAYVQPSSPPAWTRQLHSGEPAGLRPA